MFDITKYVKLSIDQNTVYQQVDGFEVNINSKYWNSGRIIPVLELLAEDLGATLFRMDALGLNDIQLVVAEQAFFNLKFVECFQANPALADRIAVFGFQRATACRGRDDRHRWRICRNAALDDRVRRPGSEQ